MTNELAVPSWLALATLIALVVLVAAVVGLAVSVHRSRRHTEELLAAAAGDAESLRAELAGLQATLDERSAGQRVGQEAQGRVPVATVDDREYVITELAQTSGPRVPARVVPAPQFADILLRESVIKTASLAAGLRRALSPQVRHRIRFEMKREVKRSRKERKAMLRSARRDWEARQRSGVEVGP